MKIHYVVRHAVLAELFEYTGDQVRNGLLRLLLVVAEDTSYCDGLAREKVLEMVDNDSAKRSSDRIRVRS